MFSVVQQLRALLVLGRISNFPTVWSNCLAAWLLNGGCCWVHFYRLCAGATLLYTGGMFLNDAFDAAFDRQHRAERPIPSGLITARAVGILGALFLLLGWLILLPLGPLAALAAFLLLAAIVIYDAIHKRLALAPLLMAGCRFLLYFLAASATRNRVCAPVIWNGLALATYVAGVSFLARGENTRAIIGRWPLALLFAPIVASVARNSNRDFVSWLATACLFAWVCWCLRKSFGSTGKAVGHSVAGLLAGIVLVDWSAVAQPANGFSFVFVGLFVFAWILQRTIPAT